MKLSKSNRSKKILKGIFTEGYELVLYWDPNWQAELFISLCNLYHNIQESDAIELEQTCQTLGKVSLTDGSIFEIDVWVGLWGRKNFKAKRQLKDSWV